MPSLNSLNSVKEAADGSLKFNFSEVRVLGVRFHRVTAKSLLAYTAKSASLPRKTVIGNVNIRAMNFAYDLPWFKSFLNRSDLVFCDGFGVLLGAKLKGYPLDSSHRMTAPDYLDELAMVCEKENISLFLLAGEPGVTDAAIAKLHLVAPNLKVQGHHGYFEKEGVENDKVIEKINTFKPDVLYVGFGMPLQEQWILDNLDKIDARVFLPLGACLDFYTGKVKRGPKFLTDNGLEWLSRLLITPGKLWKRYILGNPRFFLHVFREMLFFS